MIGKPSTAKYLNLGLGSLNLSNKFFLMKCIQIMIFQISKTPIDDLIEIYPEKENMQSIHMSVTCFTFAH